MDVTFVTSNARKLAEARAILGATPALTLTSRALDLPELQGEPEDVARAKARRAASVVNGPALVEDTSLCYDALGGLPGVYVKWFLEKTGPEGLVDALAAYDDKSAEALCVLAYATGPTDEAPRTFVGRTRGRIVRPRGSRDFGWDCVFEPEGRAETYAEMDAATKAMLDAQKAPRRIDGAEASPSAAGAPSTDGGSAWRQGLLWNRYSRKMRRRPNGMLARDALC